MPLARKYRIPSYLSPVHHSLVHRPLLENTCSLSPNFDPILPERRKGSVTIAYQFFGLFVCETERVWVSSSTYNESNPHPPQCNQQLPHRLSHKPFLPPNCPSWAPTHVPFGPEALPPIGPTPKYLIKRDILIIGITCMGEIKRKEGWIPGSRRVGTT